MFFIIGIFIILSLNNNWFLILSFCRYLLLVFFSLVVANPNQIHANFPLLLMVIYHSQYWFHYNLGKFVAVHILVTMHPECNITKPPQSEQYNNLRRVTARPFKAKIDIRPERRRSEARRRRAATPPSPLPPSDRRGGPA